MKTTLNKIRKHHPYENMWAKLLKTLGKTKADDEPVDIKTIYDSNGYEDALWRLRAVDGHDREIRLFAVLCARQVEYLLSDQRSKDALDAAERYAHNQATREELEDAMVAAWATASDAAWDAAWATAWNTAMDAAWDSASEKQKIEFLKLIHGELQ